MKKILFLGLGLMMLNLVNAQTKKPVQWSFSVKKINATTYELHLTADIESGWHIYSQTTAVGGPVPTSIEFTKNPLLALDGKVVELGKLEQHFEPLFGVEVKQFSDRVDFVQKLKLKGKAKTNMNGKVEFMTCNDRECLPPTTEKFSIAIK